MPPMPPMPPLPPLPPLPLPKKMCDGTSSSVVNLMNKYRALHGSPPLTWNTSLANSSNAWVQYLQNKCTLEHSGFVGENMFASMRSSCIGENATQIWYDEGQGYKNTLTPGTDNAHNYTDIHQFIQLTWSSTTQVGCATATYAPTCALNSWTVYVCRFYPTLFAG